MSQLAIDVDGLRPKIGGEVITPEHSSYEEARRVWNGMIDRQPALIVRCTSAEAWRLRSTSAVTTALSSRFGAAHIRRPATAPVTVES